MTTIDHASLIAEAREAAKRADWYMTGESPLLRALADSLEAAEQERDEARKAAEDHVLDADAVHVRLSAELREVNQERDNWKMSAEEAERAEKRWKDRAVEAERERDRLDEAFDRDLPWRYDEVREQRNALAAEVEELRAERDEFKRLFTECHPVHLEGVQRAYRAEATLVKAREYIEALSNSPEHPLEAHHRGVLLAILDESPTERETPADEWEYGLADDGATEPYSDISTDRDWILDGVHPLDEGTKLLRRRPAGPWMEVVPDDRA